jgi:prepilin-type N-terminal cleavage/methylation domain-containing protein
MKLKKGGHAKGFTLLELLIVVSIIAILSVALVIILDPAEALRKSRDAQRISDMNTMKTAIGLYLTSTSTPYLGNATSTAYCRANLGTPWAAGHKIFYSYSAAPGSITDATLDGGSVAIGTSTTTPSVTDGTGWIPVNFDSLTGGSPISNIPLDPVNTISAVGVVTNGDKVYRYGCLNSPLVFEMDAVLESTAYTSVDNKMTTDGGNNSNYYEVGTNLKIFGTGTDF